MKQPILIAILAAVVVFLLPHDIHAQRGGQPAGPPPTPKASAPVDLTGYWVSVVSEDWRWRMMTPPKGDYQSLPLSAEGRRTADAWDPAKDEAAGDQCKAYGAAGIMRLPVRLNIAWENDATLRIDIDAGTQTRLLRFGAAPSQAPEPSWQGQSVAQWEYAGGRGPAPNRPGNLKIVTNRMRPGYLRRNGIPYSGDAVMTEYIHRTAEPNGDSLITLMTIVEDTRYLSQPLVTTTQFKKLPNASGWNPTPCAAR